MKVPSKQLIEQLNIIHKNFVWNNKRPKIKHSTLIASYSEGGYNDIDINTKLSSIKMSWVTRLIDDNFHPWKIIPSKIFSVFGGTNIIFHTNTFLSLCCRKNVDKIPSFYRDLVYLWLCRYQFDRLPSPPGTPGAFAPKCVPSPGAFAQQKMPGGWANKG